MPRSLPLKVPSVNGTYTDRFQPARQRRVTARSSTVLCLHCLVVVEIDCTLHRYSETQKCLAGRGLYGAARTFHRKDDEYYLARSRPSRLEMVTQRSTPDI